MRMRKNGSSLGRQRQRLTAAIHYRPANRGKLHLCRMLTARERVETRTIEQDQHEQPEHRDYKKRGERQRQPSDPGAALLVQSVHGAITTCPRAGGARWYS